MQSAEIYNLSGSAVDIAAKVLDIEIEGIESIRSRLDARFDECVELLYGLPGRVIITGVGKSGLIGRKIAATFTSTGSPAIFVHPVEGLHGDLGIVTRDDVLLALSYSGETMEITSLVATVKRRGVKVIALTGVVSSTLARVADLVLDVRVPREACPLNMAPTASTTAVLALGDALAVALMLKRGFKEEDFLRHHPAGSLGERLKLTVKEIMLPMEAVPAVSPGAPIQEIVSVINSKNLGFTLVVDGEKLVGIITDGDLRRALEHKETVFGATAETLMTTDPLVIGWERTAAEALEIMERKLITALAVVGPGARPEGVIHLHDLLGKGEVRFTP
jgi:arabinose-5-phosphate isomerase